MRRDEMELGVLYAIKQAHHYGRPGMVTDPGTPPGKVKATIYWSWPAGADGEQDWLETDAGVILAGKSDECEVTTADVLKPWREHVAEIRAERQARLDEKAAEEAAEQAKRQAYMDRVDAILAYITGLDHATNELLWAAKSGNMHHANRWTSAEVLAVIEHLTSTKARTNGKPR